MANENKTSRWLLNEKAFGPLWQFIINDDITDVDWDSGTLWVSSIKNGTSKMEVEGIDEDFVRTFGAFVANSVGAEFNQVKNTLSAETDTLRITFVHDSLATSGISFSIRKSMPNLRFTATDAIKSGYCDEELMHLLVNAVKIHQNFVYSGEPGTGKTECAKFFSTFIRDNEKVITVEDTLEWHYKYINPEKRSIELKVASAEDYTTAIGIALRMNPSWLMLSEARSRESEFLLEGWSTGVHGMTTIHAGGVADIPDRFTNMVDKSRDLKRVENNVYSYLNIGIQMKKEELEDGDIVRKINEVGLFRHTNAGNECIKIMENGVFYKERIPKWFLATMTREGISNPFFSKELADRLASENNGKTYGISNNTTELLTSKKAIDNSVIDVSNIDYSSIADTIENINRG